MILEPLRVVLFLHWVASLGDAVQCRYEIDLKSYPNDFKRLRDKCVGTSCVFMNMTAGLDTAKKTWVGYGYGCDPPHRPLCRSLGAVNQCVTLNWQTLSVFGIATVTIKSPKDGVLCCCDGSDFCDPLNPSRPKNLPRAGEQSSSKSTSVTGPPKTSSVGGNSPSTTTRVSNVLTGSNQIAGTCDQCRCECTTVNGSRSNMKSKFNIGIFLGVYVCVVAAAVVISPSYMLARCLPQE